ncbi:MAG: prefoldin subunit alpha [Nanoarchaeota archaeon]|nr:prefoldin subunit alpha [Nanoarchaeota archaeon]
MEEEKLNEELVKLEYLRREIEEDINTLNLLQYTQDSVSKSLLGLDRLSISDENEVLIPYGSEIFFRGKITDTKSAIVGLGNNIFKRMNVDELRKKLSQDFDELNKNIEKLARTINDLQEEGERLEKEVNEMYEEFTKNMKQ